MHFESFATNTRLVFCIGIATLSFALLIIVQPLVLVNGDEGVYVQYARMFERGFVPVAEYEARTPILLFLIGLSWKIFGASMLAFRLPVLLAGAFTSGFLYLLGERLFSHRVGVTAGLLYAFNPYVLWSNGILRSEMLTILFTVIGMWLLVRSIKEQSSELFLSGVFFGLAFLERHSGAGLFLVGAFYVLVYLRKSLSLAYKRLFVMSAGFLLGFLPVFLWIAWHNIARAVGFWFGISLSLITLSSDYSTAATEGFFSYALIRDWGLLLVEDLAVQGWILFAGLVVFLAATIRVFTGRIQWVGKVLIACMLLVFLGAFTEHALGVFFTEGDLRPEVFLLALVVTPLFFVPFFMEGIVNRKLDYVFEVHKDSIVLLLAWMCVLVVLYSFWTPTYLREFIPPLTLASAFVIGSSRFFGFHNRNSAFALAGVLGLYVVALLWFVEPLTGGWWWTQRTMNESAVFLQERTVFDESILAANPLPVMLAERRVFADISSFAIIHARTKDDHWAGYPSPNEFVEMIQKNPPKFALVDGRMKKHFFAPYPMFGVLVEAMYRPIATFGTGKDETQVWERKF